MRAVALALTPDTPFANAAAAIDRLAGLAGPLNQAQADALLARLDQVEIAFNAGSQGRACSHLAAFLSDLDALVESATLTEGETTVLRNIAAEIASEIPCSF